MSDVKLRRTVAAITYALLATACGSEAAAPRDPAPAPDAPGPTSQAPAAPAPTMTPPLDHGSVSTTYPAFAPDIAQLVNQGGRVLTSPVVVTVTWSDDPNVATLESVGDSIGASPFWKTVVGEYGVGALTSGASNHVHLTTPLVLSTDPNADPVSPIMQLITDALANPAASGWPAPTDQSLYIVYLHGANADTLCQQGAGGLHDSVKVGDKDIPFAISAACSDGPGGMFDALESATISASHELAEAAVDPFPSTAPAWVGLSGDQLAWELLQFGQDENGDMCEFYDDAYGMSGAPQLPFMVQRTWSNKSAAAGHAPCVPAPKDPNFNVAPLAAKETVVADFSKTQVPFAQSSKGFQINVGQTRKIPIGFYTDGPTAPFTIEAFEADPFSDEGDPFSPTPTPSLTVSVDKTSGQNGEKAYLDITANKATPEKISLVVVRSTLGGVVHYLPLIVGPGSATSAPAGGGTGGGKGMMSGGKREVRAVRARTSSSPSARAQARGLGRR
jgi:hypothetical protein